MKTIAVVQLDRGCQQAFGACSFCSSILLGERQMCNRVPVASKQNLSICS